MEKIFWMDLEMTGLDVNKEVIIEVAAIITDVELSEIDTYHAVVNQPDSYLKNMDEWNQTHHRESGLLKLIPDGKSPDYVEQELIDLANKHFRDEKIILAGNTIGQDRLFLDKYMTQFSERLHYRMLDVTSWKLMFNNRFKKEFDKQGAHRAVDDIRESIDELKYYLSFIQL